MQSVLTLNIPKFSIYVVADDIEVSKETYYGDKGCENKRTMVENESRHINIIEAKFGCKKKTMFFG